jgi:hypothetical protein
MAFVATFLLGIVNFAMHQAVLRSRQRLVEQLPLMRLGARVSLGAEFVVLLGAMLLVGNGLGGLAWFYAGYSALNGLAAWLLISRRI